MITIQRIGCFLASLFLLLLPSSSAAQDEPPELTGTLSFNVGSRSGRVERLAGSDLNRLLSGVSVPAALTVLLGGSGRTPGADRNAVIQCWLSKRARREAGRYHRRRRHRCIQGCPHGRPWTSYSCHLPAARPAALRRPQTRARSEEA